MTTVPEALEDVEGTSPRVIARLESLDFEIEYMRDDVEGRYSEAELEEAYRLIMANQITGDDFKELIGKGRYEAQTLFFEDVVVCLFPSERYEAVFASFDYDDDFPVIDLVRRATEARLDATDG